MWVGFFWAAFIALLTVAGYAVGQRMDEEPEGLADLLDRIIQSRR